MVQRLKVTHFYAIPCVLQKLKKKGDVHVRNYNLTSLRTIAVGMFMNVYNSYYQRLSLFLDNNYDIIYNVIAGEPLPVEIEDWYFNEIGHERCVLIDAWGQTGITKGNQFIVYLSSLGV